MSCVGAHRTLAELRSLQDWYHPLSAWPRPQGVAEVASVGGFVRQYKVVVDPQKLRRLTACRSAQRDRGDPRLQPRVGGRVVEMAETEFMVRGRGYLRNTADLEQIVLKIAGPARRCCCATWRASSSGPTSGAASPSSTARARW